MPTIPTAERLKAASKGEAMPGGRYPIRNTAELGDAVKDWVRTGRPGSVKEWIVKSAKRLDVPAPPELSGGGKPTDELDVARARDETDVARAMPRGTP